MQFYIWVNYINPHQSPFINALAARPNNTVTLIPEVAVWSKRTVTNWVAPELKNVNVVIKPSDSEIKSIILQSEENSMHIFHGMHCPELIPKALKFAIKNKKRIAVWSEPYNWLGFKGQLRFFRSIYHKIKYDNGIDIFLSTGDKGIELLLKAGHSRNKIFDWGYFTEKTTYESLPKSETFNIGFAGFLIHRKGVDYLLHAIAKIQAPNICVNIVGEGPSKKDLEKIINEYSLKNVHFQSFIKADLVSRFMAMQDLFILPSRLDGWGAVVNEALMQGTPVICSDNCGASVLLNKENQSGIFKSGSVESLAALINERIQIGKLKDDERNKIKAWAECISGENAATYFMQIINHVYNKCDQPIPPWKTIH